MITPPLVILMIVIGWSAAALAMLWGMLRIARHHHKASPSARPARHQPASAEPHAPHVSLTA